MIIVLNNADFSANNLIKIPDVDPYIYTEVIPKEGPVSETFPQNGTYSNGNGCGQSYTNRTNNTQYFNIVKTNIKGDYNTTPSTYRIIKFPSSCSSVNGEFLGAEVSSGEILYEGEYSTQIILQNNVSLKYNETIVCIAYRIASIGEYNVNTPLCPKSQEISKSTYYPTILTVEQGTEKHIYCGWVEYACVPPTLIMRTHR